MNDETNGQLTENWTIPDYAQGMLWLETDDQFVQVVGEHGLFKLDYPAAHLLLHWGKDEGAVLRALTWRTDSLEWQGEISQGGHVEAIHISSLPGLDFEIALIPLWGKPLMANFKPYPTALQRSQMPYISQDFESGLLDECEDALTTWLVHAESPLVTLAQDAMMNDGNLCVWGRLAAEETGFHRHIALPLLLESATLFPPLA